VGARFVKGLEPKWEFEFPPIKQTLALAWPGLACAQRNCHPLRR